MTSHLCSESGLNRDQKFLTAVSQTINLNNFLKYRLQHARGLRWITDRGARWSHVVVGHHVMNEQRQDDGQSTTNNPGREACALRDAVDETGAFRAILDGGGIGLSVALRPLLDEAAHAVALEVLNQGTYSSARL